MAREVSRMRRIVVSEFVSLDGVMQAPGGREEKDILVYGSAKLVNTLLQHDLVDELRLMVHPVVLGSGRRLFDDHAEMLKPLKLAESKTFPSGIVLLSYHQAK